MSAAPPAATSVTDFASFAADGEAVMTVRNPNTEEELYFEGKPVTITLYGLDSPQFIRAEKFQQNRQAKAARRGQVEDIAELYDEGGVEILASATKTWSAMPVGGENIVFSKESVREVYRNPKLRWLRQQVNEFIGSRRNFSTASSKTS